VSYKERRDRDGTCCERMIGKVSDGCVNRGGKCVYRSIVILTVSVLACVVLFTVISIIRLRRFDVGPRETFRQDFRVLSLRPKPDVRLTLHVPLNEHVSGEEASVHFHLARLMDAGILVEHHPDRNKEHVLNVNTRVETASDSGDDEEEKEEEEEQEGPEEEEDVADMGKGNRNERRKREIRDKQFAAKSERRKARKKKNADVDVATPFRLPLTRQRLLVGDALRMFRRRTASERLVTALTKCDKHLCVFGNVASARRTDPDYDDQERSLRDLLTDDQWRAPPPPPSSSSSSDAQRTKGTSAPSDDRSGRQLRILYADDDDLWMFRIVFFAAGARAGQAGHLLDDHQNAWLKRRDSVDALMRDMARAGESDEPTVAIVRTSPHHPAWKFVEKVDAVWYGYEEADAHLVRLNLPVSFPSTLDVRQMVLPQVKGERRTYRTYAVNTVIYANVTAGSNPLIDLACAALILGDHESRKETTSVNNFLEYHGLPFLDASRRAMDPVDAAILKRHVMAEESGLSIGRPKEQVLEQFGGEDEGDKKKTPDRLRQRGLLKLRVEDEVRGFHGTIFAGRVNTFTVKQRRPYAFDNEYDSTSPVIISLRNVPIRVGDRVRLSGQRREPENRTYVVTDTSHDAASTKIEMASPAWVAYDPERDRARIVEEGGGSDHAIDVYLRLDNDGRQERREKKKKSSLSRDTRKDTMRALLALLEEGDDLFVGGVGSQGAGLISGVKGRTDDGKYVRVRADLRKSGPLGTDDGKSDPTYYCVSDPIIQSREQCEAEDDGVWDRPCRYDAECPFYQANKNYKNYRGGCLAGYCEMPLGLERKGHRYPDTSASSFPLCHGCGQSMDPRCCDRQLRENGKPDYAFEMDEYERYLQMRGQ